MRQSERFAGWAEQLLDDPAALSVAAWPRAAAFLGRSALEAAMLELWKSKEPAIAGASARAQLLCLTGYVDSQVAADIAFAYSALSSACHHHPYDLPPTAAEIGHWLDMVDELITATSSDGSSVEV